MQFVDRYQSFEARTASKFMTEAWKKYVITQRYNSVLLIMPQIFVDPPCKTSSEKSRSKMSKIIHREDQPISRYRP